MSLEEFISFVNELADEELYNNLENFDAKYYFTHGGCFEFAKIIKHYFPNSKIMINGDSDHCAIFYKNNIYDTNGVVEDKTIWKIADEFDIKYMQNNFGNPEFKKYKVDNMLIKVLKRCNMPKFSHA